MRDACAADPTPAGVRDAALIGLLQAGLRRSEVVGLDQSDVELHTGALTIRGGKGQKDRLAYLPPEALAAVSAWVAIRGGEAGALLYPVHCVGRLLPRRLSDQAVLNALQKRADQSGVAPFSPHDFRRTFISELLDAGVDIVTVQQLVGHASPTTTARYDRRGEAAKRQAVALLSVPAVPGSH